MKKIFGVPLLLFVHSTIGQTIPTKFEQTNGLETPTYNEIIDWWRKLDAKSDEVKMLTMGITDAGLPLHLVIVSGDRDFNFPSLKRKNRRIILINNGIHPGEPDGIDASMLLVRDIVVKKYRLPANVVLAIIPVYNIGGCLNRSSNYRIDQNGPPQKGFRGNSQNLDLNRDFIKCDSKEAKSFAQIFHLADPDIFLDNHVSDGADYQHVMTLITSQHNKLGGAMGEYLNKEFGPALHQLMESKGYDLLPYVNFFGDKPENGWQEFWDSPRYSSGYAALWNCFGFISETHMLKPYEQRVRSTYALMQCFIEFASKNSERIGQLRRQAKESVKSQKEFPIHWEANRSHWSEIDFKGYEAMTKTSQVSGLPVLFYDRTKPFERKIKFFDSYEAKTFITKPTAYIIPQGWWRVIDLLKLNHVEMRALQQDTTMEVEAYHIDSFETSSRPYEMHHLNGKVKVSASRQRIYFRKGDWYIPLNQAADRFLIETLEPQGEDSYFTWNFFDSILGQKEGFSDYAFEEIAATYLNNHPELKEKLEQRRRTDSAFANNAGEQLNFVYQHSPYTEPDYLRYPIYRLID